MATTAERKARIRAATEQARRQAIARREARARLVRQAYQQAGDAIADWLKAHAGADGEVAVEQLPAFDAFLSALLARLREQWEQALAEGLTELAMVGAALAEAGSAGIAAQALEQLRAFVGADGLQLSDRLWRINTATRQRIVDTVRGAILRGATAREAARALLGEGQGVPSEIAASIRAARAGSLSGAVADALLTGAGNPTFNAERVLRTEMNRAFTESFVSAAFQHQDVAAVKFNLSPAHPRPDICFSAGTPIATARGAVAIEDVRIGDLVLTHAGRFRPVVRLYRNPLAGPMLRLRSPAGNSRTRPVDMTANHPVLTHAGWIAVGDLRKGDRLATVPRWLKLRPSTQADCAPGTASPGSARNEPIAAVETACAARCDESPPAPRRTRDTPPEGVAAPTAEHSPGAGIARWSGFLRPILGCLARACRSIASAASMPASTTCQGAAGHSSGWLRLAAAGMPLSSISPPRCSSSQRTTCRTRRTSAGGLRGASCSRALRRKIAGLRARAMAALRTWCRTRRTSLPHTGLCVSYIDYSTQRIESPRPQTVFNLEVEDDHSYVAGGWVVHNCDVYASANLHGLGPGVYPKGAHPYPAHPQTLSYLTVVFADEITAEDRAGRQGMGDWLRGQPPAVQEQVLGIAKAQAFREGALADADLLRPWRDIAPPRSLRP